MVLWVIALVFGAVAFGYVKVRRRRKGAMTQTAR